MIGCWCGYLSGAKCRLFAYGPADAKTTLSLASFKSRLVLPFWGAGLPDCPGKEAVERWCVCYAAFNASCFGHKDDEPQVQTVIYHV